MGGVGFPSLVVLSVEFICFVPSFAEFLLLIVVYNIGDQSLRIELCSLYSITCYSSFFLGLFTFTHCNETGRLLRRAARVDDCTFSQTVKTVKQLLILEQTLGYSVAPSEVLWI